MKADPDLADIPVVFLTGRTDTADIVEGLRLGAHDYLKKPFEPAELIARVSAAVRLKVLQDELRLRNAELDAHRPDRCAHRTVQPTARRGDPGAAHLAGAAPQAATLGADDRHRPLQGGQRPIRPPRRRCGSARARGTAAPLSSDRGRRRAVGWGGIPGDPAGDRSPRARSRSPSASGCR